MRIWALRRGFKSQLIIDAEDIMAMGTDKCGDNDRHHILTISTVCKTMVQALGLLHHMLSSTAACGSTTRAVGWTVNACMKYTKNKMRTEQRRCEALIPAANAVTNLCKAKTFIVNCITAHAPQQLLQNAQNPLRLAGIVNHLAHQDITQERIIAQG